MFFEAHIYNNSTAYEVSNDTHGENIMISNPSTPSANGESNNRSLLGQSNNIGILKLANHLNARFSKPNSANFELPKEENSLLSQNIKQSDYSSSFLFKSQQSNLFQQEKKALLELKPVVGLFSNDINTKIQENIMKSKLKRAAEEDLPNPAKKFKAEDRTPIKINIQPVSFLPAQSPKPLQLSVPASPSPMEFSIDDQMNLEIEKLMQDSSVFENAPSIYDISQAPRGAQQQNSSINSSFNNNLKTSQDQVVNDAHIENLLESLRRASEQVLLEQEPSPVLLTTMRSYQKQALAWMIHREQSENNSMFNYDPSLIDADQHHCRSLPLHWKEMTTSQGKRYYYNEVTRQTTWKFPYDAVAAQLDENNNQAKAVVRGGILADEMGMGKTLEMLSLVVSNPLNTEDFSQRSGSYQPSKTTLIVCPLSVLHQWYSEIKRHTQTDAVSVYIYHGANRRGDLKYLSQFDIVLTTYATLATEFPSQGKAGKGKKDIEQPIPHEKKGPILQVPWYRVILDEAQTIKDRTTRTARAAFCLQAERHWCVTGTPIQNKLDDLFSLLHFLRVRPYGEHNWWNQIIMKPIRNRDERGFTRLQTILQMIMLRRTKDQLVNNQPIVALPPRNINMQVCEFNEEEREFYKQLWDSSKSKFDELFSTGTVLNNYAHILEILLRLRQACDHPQLVIDSRIHTERRKQEKAAAEATTETAAPAEARQEPTQTPAQAFEDVLQYFDLDLPLGLEDETAVLNNENSVLNHDDVLNHDNVLNNENNALNHDDVLSNENSVLNHDDILSAEPSSVIQAEGWASRCQSTKIAALTAQLKELYYGENSQPDDKCIIFSQWTSMLDLLQEPLKQLGLKFCRLDGAMPQYQREQAVKDFNSTPEIKLFLISMKAGGLGLNLVSANRVFLLDPWWNPSTEDQAIDRVHRIGQTKPVYVTRFVVKDTIEERILELQEKKKILSQGALGMKKNELRQIRIDELKLLFRDN